MSLLSFITIDTKQTNKEMTEEKPVEKSGIDHHFEMCFRIYLTFYPFVISPSDSGGGDVTAVGSGWSLEGHCRGSGV